MPVAHYNAAYLTTDVPHPAYRSYDRGVGPPAGSLGGGVPLPPPNRPPAPHIHPNGTLVNNPSRVPPTFSLPHSGVPYTGPFPVSQSGAPGVNYHGGLSQMAISPQNATHIPNHHGTGAPMGSTSSNCPVGYPSSMGYPSPHHPQHSPHHPQQSPHHPQQSPHHPQQLPSQVMDHPHDHYIAGPPRSHSYQGLQYSSYGTPPEEGSRYHHNHHHPQHREGMPQDLPAVLPTIYEDCPKGNGKYPGGYLQQPTLPEVRQHHHSSGQTCLNPPEVQEHHAPPQVLPSKIETEWWAEGDVLDRLQQIDLHPDNSPSRERTPRRKRRNSERRKEKSRDAARCRRGKESEIFTELANALPLPAQTIAQLDKASVMRLTIAFLKTRALCQAGLTKKCDGNGDGKLDVEMDALFLKALDGFLLVLSTDGDIIYTSESIASFLGLPQVDVMGQSLYEYTHPCDHDEVRELVSGKGPTEARHGFLRLKCTLTAKGRSVNLKSASYKVVQISGELVQGSEDEAWLVALGTPVPHPSNIEFPLDKQTFVSKHSLDMKFTYVDDNVGKFCGYVGDELMGRSLYEMHHALDSDLIKDAYKTLRSKGQVETGRYRFLARDGGYVWVVTQATLIHGPKDHKPQYVVCLNYIVSGVESPGEVLSELQLRCSNSSNSKSCGKPLDTTVPVAPVVHTIATPAVPQPKCDIQPKVTQVVNGAPAPPPAHRVAPAPPPPPTPVASTFKIFTPRTEEMNKGYLIFSKDDPLGIVLKDEPEDLTHLAPSGGDTCVPLEVPTFIPELDDMFTLDYKQIPISSADALFNSPTAISDDSLEQGKSPKYDEYEVTDRGKIYERLSGGKNIINTSDNSSPLSTCSSPAGGLRTPEPPKPLLSQASLFESLPGSKTTFKGVVESSRPRTTTESLFTQLDELAVVRSTAACFNKLELKLEDQNMDSDEFDMRAPYIPLSNELLMLNQDDDLMWGAPEPIISPAGFSSSKRCVTGSLRDSKCTSIMQDEEDSSLAQLLRDTDPPITGSGAGRSIQSGNTASQHRNQFQQSKFLDGGGSFVDPNKVLPGHFVGKDGLDDGAGGGTVEEDPPQVMMHEPVEPPPPLGTAVDSHLQSSLPAKRRHSPSSSPLLAHKKLCSLLYNQQHRSQQSQEGLQLNQHQVPQMRAQQSGVRELTTPYAPTMQQLLISKEPITVRGGRPGGGGGGGGISTPLSMLHKGKDSVLRNLLNLSSDGEDSSNGGDHKLIAAPVRITQDKMTAMLLADGGSINASSQLPYAKLRIVTGGQSSRVQAEHHSLKMTSGFGGGGSSSGGASGEGFLKRGRRQDPFLLMDPDLSIPNLLDLSQLDYEVNAPANNSLLQGADLLMALDQSL